MYRITEEHDLSDVNFKGIESYRGGSRGPNAGEWGHFRVPKGRVGEGITAKWWHLVCLQSVFQFSWTKFDEYLNKKLFDYLKEHRPRSRRIYA
jgi:hypothetical protein